MTTTAENNKRIAKNTGMLYFRMILIMLVTLYTSRVVLQTLGVTDFGIYNVVGGVVTMLNFLNSSLSTATQRYMNYEMGKGNMDGLQKVFSMSFFAYCMIAVVAVILAETIGLWFIYNKLIIPVDRLQAAIWVFHFSVLTFVVNLLTVPYNAAIIAHERMSIYAYISVAEVVLKLLLVFLLQVIDADKLGLYGMMMCIVAVIVCWAYRSCCLRSFPECRLRLVWDKGLLKGLFFFSGWMLSGTITNMLSTQGVNFLINMFFGPVLNAARAVAMQVYAAVNSFVANFMTAMRPQIVKSYAQGDFGYMYRLVFSASKFSFFLLFILTVPLFFNMNQVLSLWLKEVPEYAVLFTQLVLIDLLINAAYGPLAYISQASGKIRDYQLVISVGFVLIALLSWGLFKAGYPVYTTFILAIVIDVLGLFARVWVLQRIVHFPVKAYFRKVCGPVASVLFCSLFVSGIPKVWLMPSSFFHLLFHVCWCVGLTTLFIWLLGMDKGEKNLFVKGLNKIIKH